MIETLRTTDGGELTRRLLGGMVKPSSTPTRQQASALVCTNAARPDDPAQRHPQQLVTTAAGYLTVKIPKVRTGSFFLG